MSVDIQIISVIGANGQPLPIEGNSLGSNWADIVKQERADDAEIAELAAKMVEKQKEAMAKQQQQAAAQLLNRQANGMGAPPMPPAANGQQNILNFLTRQQKLPNGTVAPSAAAPNGRGGDATTPTSNGNSSNGTDEKKTPCDEESVKGHFGWTLFSKVSIPYIYRSQEKYVSVRMIEMKLLGKYLNCLHPDIYSNCTSVRSYYITDAEARLLIEINHKHCDGEFGREIFTPKDLIVRLTDATKFHQFLDICYRKLISGSKSSSEKCGFIRINKESVVPYTVRNGEQVVPLFYFEGETENLKQKADYLSGWDLAYLKFCCKVQGIRNELFSSENVAVISLTDIKSYFPNGTEFEDYWPNKVVDTNLLIGNRSNVNNSVNWTRQPSHPPPKVAAQTQKNQHSMSSVAAQQQMLKRASANAANNAFAAQNIATAMQQPGATGQRMHSNNQAQAAFAQALANNASWMSQPNNFQLLQAQMLAQQQAAQQSHPNTRAQYRNPMENLLLNNRQAYSYNNPAISMQSLNTHAPGNAPPPLVRSAAGQNANHMSPIEQTLLQHQLQQQRHTMNNQNSSVSNSTSLPHNQKNMNPSLSSAAPSSTLSSALSHSLAMPNPYSSHNKHSSSQSNSAGSSSSHQTKSNSNSTSSTSNSNNRHFNLLEDYTNYAFWNQLTAEQRLLFAQHIKNGSLNPFLNKNSFLNSLPQLPLDTELTAVSADFKARSSSASQKSNDSNNNRKESSASFMKPNVPPLISVSSLEPANAGASAQSKRSAGHSSNLSLSAALHSARAPSQSAQSGAVHLSPSSILNDVEKKYNFSDEMKAVVQKVLSNPDLSTFIQTNHSSTFVPFISPPISPATNAGTVGNSLSIIPSPNVTITPQPASLSSSRLKSVICNSNPQMNVPPSPSASSNSNSTPSPSPTRMSSGSSAMNSGYSLRNSYNTPSTGNSTNPQHHHHNHHYTASPTEVIDLSSPRRSLQAAAYMQQQAQHQQVMAAAHTARNLAAAAAAASQQQNGLSSGSSSSNSASSGSSNSASMHLQRQAALAAKAAAAAAAAAASDNQPRWCVIPEVNMSNIHMQPYKVQQVFINNQLVPCVNMKAFTDSDQLMTLTDFQKFFFPSVSLEQCKRFIEALGVDLYKGNRKQNQILMEHDRTHNENIPLVQARDVMKYMNDLTYMMRNQEQPPSKRTRIS